jgi:anti-anti-sigma factor
VWVRVNGRGSFQNSAGLKDFAAEMTARGHREFVVDLKDCELMDSTFLGTLAGIALKLRPAGQLRVIRANDRCRSVMANLGLDRVFTVDGPVPEAPPAAALEDTDRLPHPAKRETIIEQWWPGLGLLLFWATVIMFFCSRCHGAQANLS